MSPIMTGSIRVAILIVYRCSFSPTILDVLHQFLYIKAYVNPELPEPVATMKYEHALAHRTPIIQHITKPQSRLF
jgi:hypothetical protein